MREIRLYGSEGGGAARSPYPYPTSLCNAQPPGVGEPVGLPNLMFELEGRHLK